MSQQLFGPNSFIDYTEDEHGNVSIYWANLPYYFFNRNDRFARDWGIAILATNDITWKKIMQIFDVGRGTVHRIKKIYLREGSAGLVGYGRGRRATEEELNNYVIRRYIELEEERGYQKKILNEIDTLYKDGKFRTTIKKSTLNSIIMEFKAERDELIKHDERRSGTDGTDTPGKNDSASASPEACAPDDAGSGTELVLDVKHGGALAALPFLSELALAKHIPETRISLEHNGFGNTELVFAYTLLNTAGVVTVEQHFKQAVDDAMGGLIGRSSMPCLSTYHNRIPPIVDETDLERLSIESAQRAHALFAFARVVYIDGHFMPYCGEANILKDYCTQRRLAMTGRNCYFVHDEHGNPVISALSDGYQRFKHHIRVLDLKLRIIYNVGAKALLEIFDRGGYANDAIIEIAADIRFICWRLEPAACERPIDAEWTDVTLEFQGNEFGRPVFETVQACEYTIELTHGETGAKAIFRALWIRRGAKESPAITNDFDLELPSVVRHLTRRWGAQENMFKPLLDHGINKIHSYRKEKYTEEFLFEQGLEDRQQGLQRLIDNPEMVALKKRRGALKKEHDKLLIKIAKATRRKAAKRLAALQLNLSELDERIAQLNAEIKQTAEKMLLMEKIEREKIVRLAAGKKQFFDCLKMCAIWSKRSIVEIVKPIYADLRDVNKFVDKILKCNTKMTMRDSTAFVEFPDLFTEQETEALRALCDALNNYKNIDVGLRFNQLVFRCH